MKNLKPLKIYSPAEERINVVSHEIGILLSLVALVVLVVRAALYQDVWHIVSFSIFSCCMVTLYVASTCYHRSKTPVIRRRLKVFDHAAIYLLIAGTYTPFTLITLRGVTGWVIFGVAWGIAITGIILKLFFTGRFGLLSTMMYVGMGWIIIFAVKPLLANLHSAGLTWLLAGGLFYTVGAAIYSIKAIKFNHAIFHILVLGGSFCHWVTIYRYL